MKNVKRFTAAVLAASMAVSGLAGCGKKEDAKNNETESKDSDVVEVSVAIWGAEDGLNGCENDPIYQKILEETGVKLVPQNITWDDAEQKIQLWATNGQLPDIFAGDYVGKAFYHNWVDQGVIRSLPENLDAYPNLKEYLTMERAQAAMKDGKYYMIPRQTYGDITYSVQDRNVAYRWDLAQKAGVTKEPETYEEFCDMIQKIVEADPENKGISGMTQVLPKLIDGFILPYGGILQTKWVEKDGQFMPSYFAGDMKAAMQLARDMYEKGVIEKDIALAKYDTSKEKFLQGQNAAIVFAGSGPSYIYSILGDDYQQLNGRDMYDDVKIAKLYPCVDGKKYYFVDTEAWSETYISSKVDDQKMDAICRLFDYLYSEEGRRLVSAGIEGEDYELVDGKVELKEGVNLAEKYPFKNPNSSISSLAIWDASSWDMSAPCPTPEKYRQLNVERHEDAVNNGYLPKYYDDVLFLSTPKKDEFVYNPSDDLLQIMMGTEPVDKMVDDLMKNYEKKGLSDMIKEVNEAAKEAGITME